MLYLLRGQDTAPRNDLWSYSLHERRWREVHVDGARAPARFGHTLIFDPVRRQLIALGQAAGFFKDLWAFQELRCRGYKGGRSMVARYVSRWRKRGKAERREAPTNIAAKHAAILACKPADKLSE